MDAQTTEDEAWIARCLLRAARSATLATQHEGQPFATLVTPAVTPDGAVLMLLSSMAAHYRHLSAEPRCALLVEGKPTDVNPQTAPRLTVTGTAELVEEAAVGRRGKWRGYWLARHPYARLYVDFADFQLWRLVPRSGLFIGGFARATTLDAAELASPPEAVAALAAAEAEIVAICNADHADALGRLAHAEGRRGAWAMVGVDCDGFDLAQDHTLLRIAFEQPVADAAGVKVALKRMTEATRHFRW